jgi:FAD/FMN-containing dehydrogenase
MVRFVRRHDLRLVARGAGHTTFGQAQAIDGIVVDLSTLASIQAFAGDRVEVAAGIRWRTLLEATVARGLTTPVVTDYLNLSVGGTLSVGGIGGMSFRRGAQVDHVLALQVVTGEGKRVACSATERRDLFEAALAGQGQCAIITRATLRLTPAPTHVRVFNLVYPDFPTMWRDTRRLTGDGRFDHLAGWLFRSPDGLWTPLLEAVAYFTPPTQPDDDALLAGLGYIPGATEVAELDYWSWIDRVPDQPQEGHPWVDLFVPGSAAEGFVASALPTLVPLVPEDRFSVLMIPLRRSRLTRPLFRVPDEEQVLHFGTLRFTPIDPGLLGRIVAGNRRLYDANRALGGTYYPIGSPQLSLQDWRRHYRQHWDALARAKRRYDPENVFASGPDLFADRDFASDGG